MTSADGVLVSMAPFQEAGRGPNPTSALHILKVAPIRQTIARQLIIRNHYLHSLPGGTMLSFGVFLEQRLLGAITLGAGPYLAYQLVRGAKPDDCLTLTRLWLSDELPHNSESHLLAIILRSLRKETNLKFLVTYCDPSAGHIGTIYQAGGWIYIGLSSATPLYDIGDGIPQHSRSLAHKLGTHSLKHFATHGIGVKMIPQSIKHRYVYFFDRPLSNRLKCPVLPYPKKER